MEREVAESVVKLVEGCRDAICCSVDEEGYPNSKAMFRLKNEGVDTFWFSTNTSSIRVGQWEKNPKASIYFLDAAGFHGVMFIGEMIVHGDAETKMSMWKEGDEMYYPLGPTDPDYSILEFKAVKGNYYHGLKRHLFLTEELRECV